MWTPWVAYVLSNAAAGTLQARQVGYNPAAKAATTASATATPHHRADEHQQIRDDALEPRVDAAQQEPSEGHSQRAAKRADATGFHQVLQEQRPSARAERSAQADFRRLAKELRKQKPHRVE